MSVRSTGRASGTLSHSSDKALLDSKWLSDFASIHVQTGLITAERDGYINEEVK